MACGRGGSGDARFAQTSPTPGKFGVVTRHLFGNYRNCGLKSVLNYKTQNQPAREDASNESFFASALQSYGHKFR
mgnify:CR=1 FL=1